MERQLYGGITLVRDMAGDARALADLARASLVGEIPAPDMVYAALMAGSSFFPDPRTASSSLGRAPGRVPWMMAVSDSTDWALAVAQAIGTGATGIKTYAALEASQIAAIGAEARRQGTRVWSHSHVGPSRPLEVARAGVASMSHACSIPAAAIPDDVYAAGQEGERRGFVDVDMHDPRIDQVFDTMRARGVVFDPTLRLYAEMEPRLDEAMQATNAFPPPDLRRRGVRPVCMVRDAYDLVRRAIEAGVAVSTGTDGTAEPGSPWPALHDELRHLHENVGLPMAEVIKAASLNGANALGLQDETGSIEPGKRADFVLLSVDPLAGPEALASVTVTVKRGTSYPRAEFMEHWPGRTR